MKNARTYFLHMRKVGENCVLEGGDTVKSIKTHENRKFSDIMVFELMNFVMFGVRWRWILFTTNINIYAYTYSFKKTDTCDLSLFHRYNLYEKINYEEQRLNIYCLLHDSYAMWLPPIFPIKKSVVNTILMLVLPGTRQSYFSLFAVHANK